MESGSHISREMRSALFSIYHPLLDAVDGVLKHLLLLKLKIEQFYFQQWIHNKHITLLVLCTSTFHLFGCQFFILGLSKQFLIMIKLQRTAI
jgi:hypothetical protein